ncbi:MAG TPA: PA14 domain-containing protein, partial [Chthoniobacteraceae bacterium]|nr:PA14 domain-containing protein [Chthoniobacteraceae bacterium]
MLNPPRLGSPFRRIRRSVLTASILPAALVTQAWAVDWNGPVTLDIDPTVAVGLVEGHVDGSAFDLTSPNLGNGPDRNGVGAGISLGIFMGQETANFAQGTTADFDNFWNDNRTWIYTGEINSGPSGLLSFAESVDDSTRIVIDGAVVLQDQVWNVPTASGVLQYTPNTYHTIEVRMGNGVGLAGPVSVNNFVANTPTDPPTGDGYGFGFSQTGATGTDGANYIKPIDPGDGTLFRHETAPAAAAGQDINVLGSSTVTLNKLTSDHITENSITFAPTTTPLTLTVNGSTPGGTLRSLSTVLSTSSSKTININGDADFAPGALSTGPVGTPLTGVVLQKTGGTGKLILDTPDAANALAGTTLRVIDGTMSIVGGGGTSSPISSLTTAIEIGGPTTGLSPVLRIGGGIVGTNFANKIYAAQDGTLEHVSPGTDTISGTTFSIEGGTTAAGQKTLTVNVSNGGLIVTGAISDNLATSAIGGTLRKLGNNTTLKLTGTTNVRAINAAEGRLEVSGQLRGLSLAPGISIGANATLALLNTDTTNFNRLPTTVTVSTGTLEGVSSPDGTKQSFRSGAAGDPTILNLSGGKLALGSTIETNFTVAPNGLIANLHNTDAGAQAVFGSYPTYLTFFAGKGPGLVTNTAANGYADLAFGLPLGGDPQMFAPIAPSYTQTNNILSRMHGKIFIPAKGTYTFGLGSDDGSMLFFDGATLISNNLYQAHTRREATLVLDRGYHDIDIGFYEGGGLNSLVVDWSGPGISGTQPIPNTALLPVPDKAAFNNPL